MNWRFFILFCVGIGVFVVSGCEKKMLPIKKPAVSRITDAIAVIHPTEGNNTRGIVRFTQIGNIVKVVADIEGLKSNSKHGFHIHMFGDFSSSDGKSAGGHYNPEGNKHGGPTDAGNHAGDLGNLEAGADGVAHYELSVSNISINGSLNPILGRGVVIHAGSDDLVSQPTGNAGARIGFGVIGVAKPSESVAATE